MIKPIGGFNHEGDEGETAASLTSLALACGEQTVNQDDAGGAASVTEHVLPPLLLLPPPLQSS